MAKEKDEMKKIVILSFLISSLFGQVNRIIDISPSAYETSVGNQSLVYRSPARNFMTKDDTLSHVTFTRMNWLGHIVSDMTYNYVEYNWKDLDFSFTYKNYGQQKHTDETGVVLNNFSPNSMVIYVGWGTNLTYNGKPMNNTFIGMAGKLISHDLYLEKGNGILMDVGLSLIHISEPTRPY